MKILTLLEGREWVGDHWIGGASDETGPEYEKDHAFKYHSGGYGPRPTRSQYAARPQPTKRMIPVKMPYDAKDSFKELVGKGNYAWKGETKTWYMNANILTDQLRQRLMQLNVEVIE